MAAKIYLSTSVHVEVPFHDCDPMNVVWHGNYPRYFEVARCELLRLFNYDYLQMHESGYMWPIVDMRIKYVASAKFGQKIVVTADLVEYENRLKINYLIKDLETGKKLTKGFTIQAAVDMNSGDLQLESPTVMLDKLLPVIA